jgi:hypothetical protein
MKIGNVVRETAEVVTGWRAWLVTETPAGLRLGSVLYDLDWPVGEPALAECRGLDVSPLPHPVPGPGCACGFYAARDPADALSYLTGRDEPSTVSRILGEVALWGHVLETESGWRGSHAYPLRLYVPDASLAGELSVYRRPVSSPPCASPSSPTCMATRSRSALRSPTSRAGSRT